VVGIVSFGYGALHQGKGKDSKYDFNISTGGGMTNSRPLLTIQQASQITGVSIPTLYKWVSQRKIPHIKMGRLVKFDPIKLDEWIKEQSVMPMPSK
jgi:excisionase family DNA binding protein